MSFIELNLNKIVVAARLPGNEMGWKCYQRQTTFQVAYIHLLFDVWQIRRDRAPAQHDDPEPSEPDDKTQSINNSHQEKRG